MATYYKCVRLDGTDFHTGTVQWAPPPGHVGDWVVSHPASSEIGDHPSEHLSVSTVPTDCTGMQWPCRLLEVEAVGEVITPNTTLPHKRAGLTFRVLRERPATLALGPQGEHVAALLSIIPDTLCTPTERVALARYIEWGTTRDAARAAAPDVTRAAALHTAWSTVWDATWYGTWDGTRYAAMDAALDPVLALLVRDLITTEQYDVLTRPWRTAIGPIHPDDPELDKP